MPLQILHGPINSGKTTALMDVLSTHLGSAIYVVPNDWTAAELRRHLIHTNLKPDSSALLGDVFISWPQFMVKLAAVRAPLLAISESTMLIYKLLGDHQFRYFKMREASFGIARQFAETICLLKQNGINTKRLNEILNTRGSLKEYDLLKVFERYEAELSKMGLLDEGDLLNQAMKNLNSPHPQALSGIGTIIFDEFVRITPAIEAVILKLKKAVKNAGIYISLPEAGSSNEAFASYFKKIFSRLEPHADKIVSFQKRERIRPAISVYATRSPIQEARLAANYITKTIESGAENELVLSTVSGSSFPDYFLEEAKKLAIAGQSLTSKTPFSAPILHELLSEENVAAWPQEAPIGEFCETCESFIRTHTDFDSLSLGLKNRPLQRLQISRTFAAVSGLGVLLDRLRTRSGLLKINKITRESFLSLVQDELQGQISLLAEFGRALPFRCLPFESGLALAAKRVVIPGMTQGLVPRMRSERLFFAEADTLSPAPDGTLDAIFLSSEEMLAIETYLFESFVAKCKDELVLAYSIIDETGAENSPSSFLDDFPAPLLKPALVSPVSCANKEFSSHIARLAEVELARTNGTKGLSYSGHITDETAKRIIRKRFTEKPLSPTSLESYAKCPFVFFVEKVLGLKTPDEVTPEMHPKDRGNIIHSILENFYRHHMNAFRDAVRNMDNESSVRKIVLSLVDKVLSNSAQLVSRLAPGLMNFSREAIGELAWQVIKLELDEGRNLSLCMEPCAFEWAFGDSPSNILKIPVDGEADVLLCGRVDRIDADEKRKHFLVIDYKTGREVGPVKKDIIEGFHLQLPLYVLAASKFLLPDSMPLGGLLLAVQLAEKRHGFVLKEYNDVCYSVGKAHSAMELKAWEMAIANATQATATHTKNIRNGVFDVKPGDKCPRLCDYEDICRHQGS